MTQIHSTTNLTERKRGQYLGAEQRGAIPVFKKQEYSNRAIARTINCSPSTVGYELQHGTPAADVVGKSIALPNVEHQCTRATATATVCRVYPKT